MPARFERGRAHLTVGKDVLKQEEMRDRYARVKRETKLVFAGIKLSTEDQKEIARKGSIERSVDESAVEKACFLADVVDLSTGEVLFEAGQELGAGAVEALKERGIKEVEIFFPDWDLSSDVLVNTIRKDTHKTKNEAILEIYRRLRPGDPPTYESAKNLFEGMFFDAKKYDFSRVGRFKFNIKLEADSSEDTRTLTPADIFRVVGYLLRLKRDVGRTDDIDNLGNRRVRSVGELLENQFRIGLVRMERAIKEKMSVHQDIDSAMPHDLINSKPVIASIKEFFGSSQLSQFMDQTNPLSEVTHKRRLSALGPGGLSRERAGFEVRDVHPTHYGRVCPIETPEGPNIGLISSLSCYARINDFGFIETPYKKVEKGRVIDHFQVTQVGDTSFKLGQIVEKKELEDENERVRKNHKRAADALPFAFYLSAWEEENYTIAQANAETDATGPHQGRAGHRPLQRRVHHDRPRQGRLQGHLAQAARLGRDGADPVPRARRREPRADGFQHAAPGRAAAQGRGAARRHRPRSHRGPGLRRRRPRQARGHGRPGRLGAHHRARRGRPGRDRRRGQGVRRGHLSADEVPPLQPEHLHQPEADRPGGRSASSGDRSSPTGRARRRASSPSGRNVLVAFMPWRGYNYEDAILVSERLVKDDFFTSIHIQEFDIEARDTKLGPEEITRDIPNVSENALRDLDESGIIRIGATVKPGDILVGKVTPKGETQLTPEEKLLRAIFGEKAGDVRDASLKCPPGIEGTVVDVKIFSRKGIDKDLRALSIEQDQIAKIEKNSKDEIRIIREEANKKIRDLLVNRVAAEDVLDRDGSEIVKKGGKFTAEAVARLTPQQLKRLKLKDEEIADEITIILRRQDSQIEVLNRVNAERIELLQKGDELPPGVIKMVKVYVAMKRKLSVGDKMAGRHGNKGVISRILAEADMPYLPDGTPIEIVLNPLGVPSRMNVGQILETHLGWAAQVLGITVATPVFDGANEGEIKKLLKDANLPNSGKTMLYDGMTGEPFEQQVTVGYIYMLKLSHLVDDKIHARSIGPYSLITQQPLGGKAQFGGQRFGEMEVWALEAYGASYTLQELLTVKSDDVEGRSQAYEAIVKGEVPAEPGLPESFNVLVRELQSLCLDVELIKR